jgi:hypothetical protein
MRPPDVKRPGGAATQPGQSGQPEGRTEANSSAATASDPVEADRLLTARRRYLAECLAMGLLSPEQGARSIVADAKRQARP